MSDADDAVKVAMSVARDMLAKMPEALSAELGRQPTNMERDAMIRVMVTEAFMVAAVGDYIQGETPNAAKSYDETWASLNKVIRARRESALALFPKLKAIGEELNHLEVTGAEPIPKDVVQRVDDLLKQFGKDV